MNAFSALGLPVWLALPVAPMYGYAPHARHTPSAYVQGVVRAAALLMALTCGMCVYAQTVSALRINEVMAANVDR